MKRNKGSTNIALFALLAMSYPLSPALASVDHASITASAFGQSGDTCLAGLKESCAETAESAFFNCADEMGLTIEDLENGSAGVYACAAWGGLSYLWCGFISLFS